MFSCFASVTRLSHCRVAFPYLLTVVKAASAYPDLDATHSSLQSIAKKQKSASAQGNGQSSYLSLAAMSASLTEVV